MATAHMRGKSSSGLLFPEVGSVEKQDNLPEVFKRIYYHLYTNSKASRAELIIEDLTLLLLCKFSAEMNGGRAALLSYASGKGSANKVLLPMLREAFPELLETAQSFALGDDSLRTALHELSKTNLSSAPAHALGEAFQALIGPRLRGERGQFFTPKSLVRAMVEILDPKPGEAVLDPACGTGGFLAETYLYQLRAYPGQQLPGGLSGVDKDSGLARLAGALLRILSRERAEVYNFNSLSQQEWEKHTGKHWGDYDVVLTNPPFGAKIGVRDETILATFDFGHVWSQAGAMGKWLQTGALCNNQDPQILFLELCVRALKRGGRLGIVLPEGVFGNKETSYVWEWLEERGEITALLDCPRTLFQPGTDTKTNVLFFTKSAEKMQKRGEWRTRVAVALHCGHDRRGRSHIDDFPEIAHAFHEKEATEGRWRSVALKGQRYLVPRYHYDRDEVQNSEAEFTQGAEFATLGELAKANILRIRKGHEVGSAAYGTGEIPFVRTSDISNFEISTDPTKAVSEAVYNAFAAQQNLKIGDLLIVVDGRYRIGTSAMLTEHNVQCVVQSHLRIISTLKRDQLDPYELLYALNLPSVKLRMRSLVFIQSTLGTLGNRLLELRIPLLHGDGPWTRRLQRFRGTLQGRASLLADIQEMSGPDYEL